uniref:Uncharacterized protein n=1 Tax=Kalanchoe fedtschenkoi TaxID=63787 RepID=A0A7N0ZSK4_KALFE
MKAGKTTLEMQGLTVKQFPSCTRKSVSDSPPSFVMHRLSFPSRYLNTKLNKNKNVKLRIMSQRGELDCVPGSGQETNKKERIIVDLQDLVVVNEDSSLSHVENNKLRWRFISKVYGVMSAQVAFCATVSAAVVVNSPMKAFICGIHPAIAFCAGLSPFLLMWPMIVHRKRRPQNLMMLSLFTISMSVALGLGCAFLRAKIVIQGLLTAGVVVLPITGYAIWGSMRGEAFRYPGLFSFSCVIILVMVTVQLFFPYVSALGTLWAGIVGIIFAGFLDYDRDELVKRHTFQEYIEASICLYLDIISLFHTTFHVIRLIVEFHCWFLGLTK